MIWTFLKAAIFIAIVGAIALAAAHLSTAQGGIVIQAAGMEFVLGPLQTLLVALVALAGLWILFRLTGLLLAILHFIAGDETALSRYFDRNRERKGYQALTEGMLAVASGEGKLAQAKAAKAERYLAKPELTGLLSAQAAEAAGDTAKATEAYKRLLEDDRTRFVGIRGLMKQKLAQGDTEKAMKLAEKAYALKPANQEVQDLLLGLQAGRHDWRGAREVLGRKQRQGLLPRDVYRRRDTVLALQEAREVFADGSSIEAREAAIAANKASPDLIPAAVLAARAYMAADKPKYAARVLKKTWSVRPHPDIAAAYAAIEPDESPVTRVRRFENLFRNNPDAEESRLVRAELLIAAEDFPAARRALGDLPEKHPTARTLTLLAAVERGEGADDAVVRGWLARALTVSRGEQWVCDTCQNIHDDWAPVCDNCGGFDTLSWREPAHGGVPLAGGVAMLPLIVGPQAATPAPEPVEIVEASPVENAPTAPGAGRDSGLGEGAGSPDAPTIEAVKEEEPSPATPDPNLAEVLEDDPLAVPDAVAAARGVEPRK